MVRKDHGDDVVNRGDTANGTRAMARESPKGDHVIGRVIQIDPRLAPIEGEGVVEKQWASGFFKTGLDEALRSLGVDSLVVTGLTTSGCVRATAVDGLQHDYRVVVPIEAVADRNEVAHRANLFDLNAKYADVMGLDEVLSLVSQKRSN